MIARHPMLIAALSSVLSLALGGAAIAGETKVAVAANFTDAAKAIAARFKAKTGHDATLSFGPTSTPRGCVITVANGAKSRIGSYGTFSCSTVLITIALVA